MRKLALQIENAETPIRRWFYGQLCALLWRCKHLYSGPIVSTGYENRLV